MYKFARFADIPCQISFAVMMAQWGLSFCSRLGRSCFKSCKQRRTSKSKKSCRQADGKHHCTYHFVGVFAYMQLVRKDVYHTLYKSIYLIRCNNISSEKHTTRNLVPQNEEPWPVKQRLACASLFRCLCFWRSTTLILSIWCPAHKPFCRLQQQSLKAGHEVLISQ